jgi:1-acyl-sn-glycerol-3-phosphate acyltransferase
MAASQQNPFRVSSFMHGLARLIFFLAGWKAEGTVHQPPRFVLIAAPHTSNWDAFIMITAAYIFRVKMTWFVKREAFFFPLGTVLRFFGAIPIDRSKRTNMVGQAIEQLSASDHLILAVPPEGTRKHSPHWKTGFYHIAHGAGVPIVLGYIDYGRKAAGLGPAFVPTGDIEADFEVFRDFYAKITPRFPERRGTVAVRSSAPDREDEVDRRASA